MAEEVEELANKYFAIKINSEGGEMTMYVIQKEEFIEETFLSGLPFKDCEVLEEQEFETEELMNQHKNNQ